MIKINFLLPTTLTIAVVVLVSGGFYGNTKIADAAPPVGWVDDGTVVRLETSTDLVGVGTTSPAEKLGITGNLFVSGNILLTGLIDGFDISSSAPSWDSAYNQRNRWDGGSDGLTASTGRASLELGSLATANAVSGGSGGTISDNSIINNDIATSTFWNISGVGAMSHIILRDTDGSDCHKITVNAAGTLSTAAVDCNTGDAITGPADSFDSYSSGTLDGKNGGTGFSAAWVKNNTGDFDIKTTGCQSGNCIADNSVGNTRDYRTFAAQASGSGSAYIKRTQNEVNNFEIGVCASGTTNCEGAGKFRFAIPRLSPFNVVLKSGGTDATLGQYSNLTWQKIDFEWGSGQSQGCSAGEVIARFAGGAWSGCKSMNAGNDPGTVSFVTDDTAIGGADEFWIDELEL